MTGAPPAEHEPRHPDLRRLLEYWHGQRGARDFPTRADIDPLDLRFMLDRIALTEVHERPRRYRLRLVGSWWARLAGFEMTGMWLDDLPPASLRKLTSDTYDALLIARRPLCTVRDSWVDDKRLSYEILLLPLAEDNTRISMIMTGIGPS
jgi:hypothetical protein